MRVLLRPSQWWLRLELTVRLRLLAMSSIDSRNTYLKPRTWSDSNVSSGWVYSSSERGALGALLPLTMAEREEISRGIVEGQSVRAIARMLARAASTVSRGISRKGGVGRYRAAAADKLAWRQALHPKPCKLAMHGPLRQPVVRKLELRWIE